MIKMKLFSILALTCAIAGAAPAFAAGHKPSDPAAPEGRVLRISQDTKLVRNKKNASSREFLVYEPAGYDDLDNQDRRYPVLYLLHGSPGNPSNFIDFGHWQQVIERAARQGIGAPAILVIPDGNYVGEKHGDSEWINSADGRDRYEDYVANEMVAWADSHLRTRPDAKDRILCGVSEGGFGSVNIGLRRPEVFGRVVAISGYYHNDGSGWGRPIMGRDPTYLHANSPQDYLAGADASSKTAGVWKQSIFYLGAGADEGRYVDETRALSARLATLGISETLRVFDGKHGWGLWNQLFADSLKTILPPEAVEPSSPASVTPPDRPAAPSPPGNEPAAPEIETPPSSADKP